MHGRKKRVEPLSKDEQAVLATKAKTYKSLIQIIQTRRAANDLTEETLVLLGKMLKNNPDVTSLWNYRRDIITNRYPLILASDSSQSAGDELDVEALKKCVADEMQLSSDGIVRNPKSYGAWDHRRWIIDNVLMHGSIGPRLTQEWVVASLEKELDLCSSFLMVDERNFHCMNYRRFIVRVLVVADACGVSADSPQWSQRYEGELEFSITKIQQNFSNYSAYHHRSVYFAMMQPEILLSKIPDELKICETCMFTEPDDQSIYWYFKHLLSLLEDLYLSKLSDSGAPVPVSRAEEYLKLLHQQLQSLCKLLSLEPNSKWVKEGLLMTVQSYEVATSCIALRGGESATLVTGSTAAAYGQHCALLKKSILQDLKVCDSNHAERFESLLVDC